MPIDRAFCPDWASAPGDTIADVLSERKISEREFAGQMEITAESARDLLEGRAIITLAIARKLEGYLGATVDFWMARDGQYRDDIARLNKADRTWLKDLPLSDMIRFGWLKPIPHPSEEENACLRYFNVPSVNAWRSAYAEVDRVVAYRKSPSFESRPAAVATWIRQGEIVADSVPCGNWDAQRFRDAIEKVRELTRRRDPGMFIPELVSGCADCGVAVAVVRAPQGCRASGATRFLTPTKALLLLSFRYLSDDHFWFTFFHEAGHLLLHGNTKLFLEGIDSISTKEEEEANHFAADRLIPASSRTEFMRLTTDAHRVIRFAKKIGVSPGIVVGQLQHFKNIRPNQLNSLKRYYEWR